MPAILAPPVNIVKPDAVGVTGRPKLAVAFADADWTSTATVKTRVCTRWMVVSTPLAAMEVVTGTSSVVVAVESEAGDEVRAAPGLSVTVWISAAATAPASALEPGTAAVVEAATAPGTKTAGVDLANAVYGVMAAVSGTVTVTVPSAHAAQALVTVVMGTVGTEAVVAPWAVQPQRVVVMVVVRAVSPVGQTSV